MELQYEETKYKLVSFINHSGTSPQCGHYTACVSRDDDSFFMCNDSSVFSMEKVHFEKLSSLAYVLFYTKL